MITIVLSRHGTRWRVEEDGAARGEFAERGEAIRRVVGCLDAARGRGAPAMVRFDR